MNNNLTEQELLNIIQNSTKHQSAEIRQQNEELLISAIMTNSEQFVNQVTKMFKDTSIPIGDRHMIGTIIHLSLRPVDSENVQSIWYKINADSKETLKTSALECLMDSNDAIKNSAANITAAIFVLDVKTDRVWFDLLNILAQNIETNEMDVKKAAVSTLGFICEYLKIDNITNLPEESVDSLIAGICNGIKTYSEVTAKSITALLNAKYFLRSRLEREDLSDYVLQLLIDILDKVKDLRETSMLLQIVSMLTFITKAIYNNFGRYKQVIFDRLFKMYELKENAINLGVNEYFIKLLKREHANPKGYFADSWARLSTQCVAHCNELFLDSELDFDDLRTNSQSYSILLSYLNAVGGNEATENFFKYVFDNIDSDKENCKMTGLIMFEALLEFSKPNEIENTLLTGFFPLLGFVKFDSNKVKILTSGLLARAAFLYPQVFITDTNVVRFIPDCCDIFKTSGNNEALNIVKINLCECLRDIVLYIKFKNPNSSSFQMFVHRLYTTLIDLIAETSDIPLIDQGSTLLLELISSIVNKNSYNDYLYQLMIFTSDVYKNYQREPKVKIFLIEVCLINIHVYLVLMKTNNITFEVKNMNTYDLIINFYIFVEDIIQSNQHFKVEGYQVLCALITSNNQFPQETIEKFYNNYLMNSLSNQNNIELFKTGLQIYISFACVYKSVVNSNLNNFYEFLLGLIEQPSTPREINLHIIYTITDLSSEYVENTINFLPRIFNLLIVGMEGAVNLADSSSKELREFSEKLRATLTQCFQTLIHSIYFSKTEFDAQFVDLLKKFQHFIRILSSPKYNAPLEFILDSFLMLFDFWLRNKSLEPFDISLLQYLKEVITKIKEPTPQVQEVIRYIEQMNI